LPEVYQPGAAALALGPEGGWIQRELDTLEAAGFAAFDLGLPVLKTEPAIAAVYAQWAMAGQILQDQ